MRLNISDDGTSEIWLLNGVEIFIKRVTYSFMVMSAASISNSPLHNSRQDEEEKREIHLQEENNYEYLSTKDIIIFIKGRCHRHKTMDKFKSNKGLISLLGSHCPISYLL